MVAVGKPRADLVESSFLFAAQGVGVVQQGQQGQQVLGLVAVDVDAEVAAEDVRRRPGGRGR